MPSTQKHDIKAVIFDCGGVFLHDPANEIITRDMAQRCGLEKDLVHRTTLRLLPYFQQGDLSETQYWALFQKHTQLAALPEGYEMLWTDKFLELGKIDEKVLNLVQGLKTAGYKTPVLSNTIPPHVCVNNARNLFDLFSPKIFSCEVRVRKPYPLIYEIAAREAGVTPQECVYVDDIIKYVEAAEKAGMKGIHFLGVEKLEDELRETGVKW